MGKSQRREVAEFEERLLELELQHKTCVAKGSSKTVGARASACACAPDPDTEKTSLHHCILSFLTLYPMPPWPSL